MLHSPKWLSIYVFLTLQLQIVFSFIQKHLQAEGPDPGDVEAMRLELEELRQKVDRLEEENEQLRQAANPEDSEAATLTAGGEPNADDNS